MALISFFVGSPTTILRGVYSKLTWASNPLAQCSISGMGNVGITGTVTVYPTVTTTYTLTAQWQSIIEKKNVTITVIQTPIPPPTPPPPTPPPPGPPPIICTPGEPHCIGNDLYRCNATGTDWVLETKNLPYCIALNKVPDPVTDFPGWIVWLLTSTWEKMLGFVTGQLNNFVGALKNFQENFMAQLAVFINDPLKALASWVDDLLPGLRDWIDEAVDGVGKWWDDQAAILRKGWDSTFGEWFGPVDFRVMTLEDWKKKYPDKVTEDIDDKGDALTRIWDETFGRWFGPVDLRVMSLEEFKDEYPDKVKDDIEFGDSIVTTWVKEWFMEQVTNYFTDALNGLNDEFDTMKEEEEEKKEPWRKTP